MRLALAGPDAAIAKAQPPPKEGKAAPHFRGVTQRPNVRADRPSYPVRSSGYRRRPGACGWNFQVIEQRSRHPAQRISARWLNALLVQKFKKRLDHILPEGRFLVIGRDPDAEQMPDIF